MAHRIDRITLWMLITCSAFILTLTWTKRPIPASVLTFLIVLFLRHALNRLPVHCHIRKKDKLLYARRLLRIWALSDRDKAFTAILRFVPEIEEHFSEICLVQYLPDSPPLTANQLLDILHPYRTYDRLLLIATCPIDANALALTAELSNPAITVIDSTKLISRIIPSLHSVPREELQSQIKKEQRASRDKRIALFIQSINPLRSGLYAAVFFLLFLWSSSYIHLSAAVLFGMLLILHVLGKRRRKIPV